MYTYGCSGLVIRAHHSSIWDTYPQSLKFTLAFILKFTWKQNILSMSYPKHVLLRKHSKLGWQLQVMWPFNSIRIWLTSNSPSLGVEENLTSSLLVSDSITKYRSFKTKYWTIKSYSAVRECFCQHMRLLATVIFIILAEGRQMLVADQFWFIGADHQV